MVPRWPAVDLWTANLVETRRIDTVQRYLDADEIHRASRFVHDDHRQQYVLRRAFRRMVLGHYLGCSPASLRFVEDGRIKPRLCDEEHSASSLCFSTSQSGRHWICAVSTEDLGVDIEFPHELPDLVALMERICSKVETDTLVCLPDDERLNRFFELWVAKEAVAKLTGKGLSVPFGEIDTGGGAAPESARCLGQRMHLSALTPQSGSFAYLATSKPGAVLKYCNISSLIPTPSDK